MTSMQFISSSVFNGFSAGKQFRITPQSVDIPDTLYIFLKPE